MNSNFKRTKYACYSSYLGMSAAFALPPMLFVTFREMYGISYTLLGTLVLINFMTQLAVDLAFTFFTKYFNPKYSIRTMPLLTAAGLIIYGLIPHFFPQYAYFGMVLGTFVFSVSAGLSEVLLSPVIAAIPSDNPEKDMSLLHSLYAYGVLSVVIVSSIYFKIFGSENWVYLTLFYAAMSVVTFILFSTSPMPELKLEAEKSDKGKDKRGFGIMLCALCIFLGSAAENTMTSWVSGYMENALKISKAAGDIVGMAGFAVFLGLGRSLYAGYGKNISRVLLFGMAGSVACYLIAGLSSDVYLSAFACVMTGLCTSMLWPGTLILMEEKFPAPGVTAYALMAAGGDFGGSVAPQLLGIVVDKVSESGWAANLAPALSLTCEQLGMKAGMLVASLFPIAGVVIVMYMRKYFKKNKGM